MKTLSFDVYLKKRLSKTEIKDLEKAADIEASLYLYLQDQITQAVSSFMDTNDLGFNDMVRLLGTSPTQFKKIQGGQANLTLASVAHLFALMNKKPRLILEEA